MYLYDFIVCECPVIMSVGKSEGKTLLSGRNRDSSVDIEKLDVSQYLVIGFHDDILDLADLCGFIHQKCDVPGHCGILGKRLEYFGHVCKIDDVCNCELCSISLGSDTVLFSYGRMNFTHDTQLYFLIRRSVLELCDVLGNDPCTSSGMIDAVLGFCDKLKIFDAEFSEEFDDDSLEFKEISSVSVHSE